MTALWSEWWYGRCPRTSENLHLLWMAVKWVWKVNGIGDYMKIAYMAFLVLGIISTSAALTIMQIRGPHPEMPRERSIEAQVWYNTSLLDSTARAQESLMAQVATLAASAAKNDVDHTELKAEMKVQAAQMLIQASQISISIWLLVLIGTAVVSYIIKQFFDSLKKRGQPESPCHWPEGHVCPYSKPAGVSTDIETD